MKRNFKHLPGQLNYDVCATSAAVGDIFAFARVRGIEVIVPENTLKTRNKLKRDAHNQPRCDMCDGERE